MDTTEKTLMPTGAAVGMQEATSNAANGFRDAKRPDQLLTVRFSPPSDIVLQFADGREFTLAIESLGMPIDRINWPTLTASPGGDKAVVHGIQGDQIPIDAKTLRYLVDSKYAEAVGESLESLRLSRAELKKMAEENKPPQEWYNQPEQDLTRKSWK